jgi:spore germination protein KC
MRRWRRRFTRFGLLCASAFLLAGCWDYQKINERAQVIGIGVDPLGKDSRLLSFTFQVPILAASGPTGGGGAGPSPSQSSSTAKYQNFTVRAYAIADALSKAQMLYDKSLYLSNLQTVVLNRRLSGQQIQSVVAELMRDPHVDKLAWLVFSPESSSKEVLEWNNFTAPADIVDRFLSVGLKQHGYTVRTRLWQFWRDANRIGLQPLVGMVTKTGKGHGIQVYGSIAFDRMNPKAVLKPRDTLYINFVKGQVINISMWVKNGRKAFEITDLESSSKISTTMEQGIPVLHARIKVRCNLSQDEDRGTVLLTQDEILRYEKVAARQIQEGVLRTLQTLQRRRLDVYGFGRYYFIAHPRAKEAIEKNWAEWFSRARADVDVNVQIERKGNLI